MKSFKYFLALPLALSSLVACGFGGDNFTKTDYKSVVKIADNYKTSISNSKTAAITVSGHINKVLVKGDVTWWSYQSKEVNSQAGEVKSSIIQKQQKKSSLLSMIPNFSIKNGEIVIDPQELAAFEMPGSLVSVAETVMNAGNDSEQISLLLIDNLPKFPMNSRLLKLINGFDSLHIDDVTGDPNWNEIEYLKWKNADVNFYSDGGRIKVTINTKDTSAFFGEIKERVLGEKHKIDNEDPEPEKIKLPGTFSVTTNKLGYIDSLNVNFKLKDYEKETEKGSLYYLYLKGDAEVDLSLKFEQTIAKPITIKYQLVPYREADDDETPDIGYILDGPSGSGFITNLIKDEDHKPIGPTSRLKELEEYVTFEWASNFKNYGVYSEKYKNYDDPIFQIDYWHGDDNAKNIAYTDEAYNVFVIPQHKIVSSGSTEQKCYVLGARVDSEDDDIVYQTSKIVTSINGRKISSEYGMPRNTGKALLSAADRVDRLLIKEGSSYAQLYQADEIFINSNMLSADGSECIVQIPVALVPEE